MHINLKDFESLPGGNRTVSLRSHPMILNNLLEDGFTRFLKIQITLGTFSAKQITLCFYTHKWLEDCHIYCARL